MSNYKTNYAQLAEQFKALSNPHRLALFHRLANCCAPGTRCGVEEATRLFVGQLGEGLDIAPSTLSHHLKELHRAGLIRTARQGKHVACWLDAETLAGLADFFSGPSCNNLDENDHE